MKEVDCHTFRDFGDSIFWQKFRSIISNETYESIEKEVFKGFGPRCVTSRRDLVHKISL